MVAEFLSWLALMLYSTFGLVLLCLLFDGAKWMDGEDHGV